MTTCDDERARKSGSRQAGMQAVRPGGGGEGVESSIPQKGLLCQPSKRARWLLSNSSFCLHSSLLSLSLCGSSPPRSSTPYPHTYLTYLPTPHPAPLLASTARVLAPGRRVWGDWGVGVGVLGWLIGQISPEKQWRGKAYFPHGSERFYNQHRPHPLSLSLQTAGCML